MKKTDEISLSHAALEDSMQAPRRSSAVQVHGDQMADPRSRSVNQSKAIRESMKWGRLLRACSVTSALLLAVHATPPAQAQTNFDRPGGDYQNSPVASGDPADCALACERDRRCHAWSSAIRPISRAAQCAG